MLPHPNNPGMTANVTGFAHDSELNQHYGGVIAGAEMAGYQHTVFTPDERHNARALLRRPRVRQEPPATQLSLL